MGGNVGKMWGKCEGNVRETAGGNWGNRGKLRGNGGEWGKMGGNGGEMGEIEGKLRGMGGIGGECRGMANVATPPGLYIYIYIYIYTYVHFFLCSGGGGVCESPTVGATLPLG